MCIFAGETIQGAKGEGDGAGRRAHRCGGSIELSAQAIHSERPASNQRRTDASGQKYTKGLSLFTETYARDLLKHCNTLNVIYM